MNIFRMSNVVLVLACLGACSKTEDGDQNRIVGTEPAVAPVEQRIDGGAVTAISATPAPVAGPKVFVVDMTVDATGSVALANPRLQYGEAPNPLGNPPMFSAELLDAAGTPVDTAPLWDPRWTFVWSDEQERDFVDLGDTGKSTVILRFNRGAAAIAISRGQERLATLDVTGTLAEFCQKNEQDPDCVTRDQPLVE